LITEHKHITSKTNDAVIVHGRGRSFVGQHFRHGVTERAIFGIVLDSFYIIYNSLI